MLLMLLGNTLHSCAEPHSVELPWQALSLVSLTLTAGVSSCCRLTGAESVEERESA